MAIFHSYVNLPEGIFINISVYLVDNATLTWTCCLSSLSAPHTARPPHVLVAHVWGKQHVLPSKIHGLWSPNISWSSNFHIFPLLISHNQYLQDLTGIYLVGGQLGLLFPIYGKQKSCSNPPTSCSTNQPSASGQTSRYPPAASGDPPQGQKFMPPTVCI